MSAVNNHFLQQSVVLINFIFCLTFQLCIFAECFFGVSKSSLQFYCRRTRLRRVCFIHDNSKSLALGVLNLSVNHREFLQCGNNDSATVIDSISQVFGCLAFANGFNRTKGMVKGRNGILQLSVKHGTVGNDDYRRENRFIVFIVQGCQTVCSPSNRVRLARTCTVLNQIVYTSSVLANISDKFANNIQLVETREDKGLVILAVNELLHDIQSTFFSENIFPEICCRISVRIRRIALATIITCTV